MSQDLKAIEQRLLWLSHWMIHNANHIRPKADGIKVGGHQASSASIVSIMTALYFQTLRPEDRVAVKPHASPIFHAIQYLMGYQTLEKMENFRGFGGVQSYPSRTKDIDDVDFSTGSVGLGVAITSFASIVQDYIQAKSWGADQKLGRMIALVGDAELDEGNIYEALQEGWKNDLRNCWWIIDYNRQSLDGVVREGLFQRVEKIFDAFGWDVVRVKYGMLQRAAFDEPGGEKLRQWIDDCPNQLYAAPTFMGGAVWRKHLLDFVLSLLADFGLDDFYLELSTRDDSKPDKFVGSDEDWKSATQVLEQVATDSGLELVADPGGAAFYGPKISVQSRDAIGRTWQMSTIQYDFNQPRGFELEYQAADGSRQQPVMIHSAKFGSIERFIGVLVEHYAGALPPWLAPVQVQAIPIADVHADYLHDVAKRMRTSGLRVEVDDSDDRMQKKIRNAQLQKVPFMMIAGNDDIAAGAVSFRYRDGRQDNGVPLDEAIARVTAAVASREQV